jgi:hypothetical protein
MIPALETKRADRHPIDLTTEVMATFPNGGRVVVYSAINRTTEDFRRILSCAKHFAKQGKHVVMPPKLDVPYKNPAYDVIYGSLKGTAYYGKCPDLMVDSVWYEHEGHNSENPKTNFSNMCRRGFRQSDRIIIEKCELTDGYMFRSIQGQIKSGTIISELWVHSEGVCRQVF